MSPHTQVTGRRRLVPTLQLGVSVCKERTKLIIGMASRIGDAIVRQLSNFSTRGPRSPRETNGRGTRCQVRWTPSPGPLRFFAAGMATETNVFVAFPTGIDDFHVVPPTSERAERSMILFGSTFAEYQDGAAAHGVNLTLGTYAYAEPAGLVSRRAYESLRDQLLSELRDAMPVDAILLTLHGAMAAEGYPDCESDIACRVRELLPEAIIGMLFDPHCDLPDELIETVDVIVCYKEYPHTDINLRARDLFELVVSAAQGRTNPTMATFDCRMIATYPTTVEPMRSFVRKLERCERNVDVLSVSLAHGYQYSDTAFVGTRTLVITDDDVPKAAALAERLGREFFDLRGEVTMWPLAMEVALERALSALPENGPIVVADVADNPGAGAPGDATFVLRHLLRCGARNVAIAMLWDPIAVQVALTASVGAKLDLRIGGKLGRTSGEPVDAVVTVRGGTHDLVQRWPQSTGHVDVPSGSAVWVEVEGLDLILCTTRVQVFGTEVFTALGLDPSARQVLVVKSRNHFHAAFAPLASEVLYMEAPGPLPEDPRRIPYKQVDKSKFPWLQDPWSHTSD